MDPQWIIAGASCIAALGIFGVIYQSYYAFKQLGASINQLKFDHERSRREKAIELLCHWDTNLTLNGAVARKFAESLSFEQSKSLCTQQAFTIDNKNYGLFLGSLSPTSATLRGEHKPEGDIEVSERESSEIRWSIIYYLNHLEAILSAVRHNVADKKIIHEQFSYLVAPSEGHYLLEDFRKIAGGATTYPSIDAFAIELKSTHEKTKPGKPLIA